MVRQPGWTTEHSPPPSTSQGLGPIRHLSHWDDGRANSRNKDREKEEKLF